MDTDRIALYLSGSFPPYYRKPEDKYEFIELLRKESPAGFSDDFFRLTDSRDFYSMCLNRIKRADEPSLARIVRALSVPEDAGGLKKSYLIAESLEALKKEYEGMEALTSPTREQSIQRGNDFEGWLVRLFELFNLDPRSDIQNGIDQIDGSFVLDGQIYVYEAEWKTKKSDKNYVVEVSDKADNLVGTLGLAIAPKGFAETAYDKIRHNTRKNVMIITGEEIKSVLSGSVGLDDLIRAIKRRGAEEGKPYLGDH